MKDAFDFIDNVIAHLSKLGMRAELVMDVYFSAYLHIGWSFIEKIIDERLITINMGSLHQLNLDILFCLARVGQVKQHLTIDQIGQLEATYGEVILLTKNK